MKRGMIVGLMLLVFLFLTGCQDKCDQKIICSDGSVYPSEQIINGECVSIDYKQSPCKAEVKETAGCVEDMNCIPEHPEMYTEYLCVEGVCVEERMSNESIFCIEEGGTINGTQCILEDFECDISEFFRGECPKLEGCAAIPIEERAICCQNELGCDVTKIAVFEEETMSCKCLPTDAKRQCAAIECPKNQFSIFDVNMGKCICVEAGTRQIKVNETKTEEPTQALTIEQAELAIIKAFDKKWGMTGGCGYYEEGYQRPKEIQVGMKPDGSFTAQIKYYCGHYMYKPPEPDHTKDLTISKKGIVKGI